MIGLRPRGNDAGGRAKESLPHGCRSRCCPAACRSCHRVHAGVQSWRPWVVRSPPSGCAIACPARARRSARRSRRAPARPRPHVRHPRHARHPRLRHQHPSALARTPARRSDLSPVTLPALRSGVCAGCGPIPQPVSAAQAHARSRRVRSVPRRRSAWCLGATAPTSGGVRRRVRIPGSRGEPRHRDGPGRQGKTAESEQGRGSASNAGNG